MWEGSMGWANKSVERSVDSLQKLYAGVVAFAIGQAITRLVLVDRSTDALATWSDLQIRLPAFLAFLVVLVPFFHGMSRHLDECYLEDRRPLSAPPRGALLV